MVNEKIPMVYPKKIKTPFGNASIENGRYRITSGKYTKKMLHTIIYEKAYNIKLTSEDHIHHIDGNPLNNLIENLFKTNRSEHSKIHIKRGDFEKFRNHKTIGVEPWNKGLKNPYSEEVNKSKSNKLKGEKNFNSKFTDNERKLMVLIKRNTKITFRELGWWFNSPGSTINYIYQRWKDEI